MLDIYRLKQALGDPKRRDDAPLDLLASCRSGGKSAPHTPLGEQNEHESSLNDALLLEAV